MLSGFTVVLISCVVALWVNDYTPWGGDELNEYD